nr:aldo/keto reductase [Kribbella sandramycini]
MGFGTMRLKPETGVEVLRRAVELGVDHFDTAAFYGPANELLRAALAPYAPELVIATKVGPGVHPERGFYQAMTAAELRTQVEENLRGLGVDVLDVVNLRVGNADSLAERFGVLAELQKAGLIRQLGVSNVTTEQLEEARAIAPVVCVQNWYSVDRRDDDSLIDLCASYGIAYVPFASIADGVATEAAQAVAAAHGISAQQLRLAWTLHRSPNILAIPGTSKVAHLEQNVAAGAVQLTPAEVKSLE